ncbi:hypothetical protein C8R43DRAFT_703571 [Mycena crocata]|nr:hypothetical protein C8R43DRAFT_703571 [Mycena crocata]
MVFVFCSLCRSLPLSLSLALSRPFSPCLDVCTQVSEPGIYHLLFLNVASLKIYLHLRIPIPDSNACAIPINSSTLERKLCYSCSWLFQLPQFRSVDLLRILDRSADLPESRNRLVPHMYTRRQPGSPAPASYRPRPLLSAQPWPTDHNFD